MDSQSNYDPKDVDHSLREIVSRIFSRVEQFYYGMYDDSAENEKNFFKEELMNEAKTLYDSLNTVIIEKANQLNALNRQISVMNDKLQDKNEELISMNRELVENQRYKDLLYNMIVHDLKSPVGAILTYIDLFREDIHDEEFKEHLLFIDNAGQILNRLILDMMDISKMEANKLIPKFTTFRISEVVDSLWSMIDMQKEAYDFEIIKNITFQEKIRCDRHLLERVIVNLLSNAFKYTPNGGKIEIKGYKNNGSIIIEVNNEGQIIPDEIKDKVFDKFFSIQSGKKYQVGTGLGLTFCKMAIEVNHGKISVVSPIFGDTGTGFHIVFNADEVVDEMADEIMRVE